MSGWSDIINNKSSAAACKNSNANLSINTYKYTRKKQNATEFLGGRQKLSLVPAYSSSELKPVPMTENSFQIFNSLNEANGVDTSKSINDYNNNSPVNPVLNNSSCDLSFVPSTESPLLIKYKKSTEDEQATISNEKFNGQKKKREVYSLFIFVFFLFVTIITLSQILVVHNQTHSSNFVQIKQMQDELKLMDATIDTMLKENQVLPMQVWYAMKQYNENLKRFSSFIDDYSFFHTASDSNNSQKSTGINQLTSHEILIDQLNFCERFTNQHLSLLEKPPHLSITATNTSLLPHLIYKLLADSLLSLKNITDIPKQEQSSYMEKFTDKLNVVLKTSLSRISELKGYFSDNPPAKSTHKKCMNSITVSLFSLFSEQYTSFFESEPKFRELLVDRYRLINMTLSQFSSGRKDRPNTENESLVFKMPLRNMKDLYSAYRSKQFMLASNGSMCSEQPPKLCNI